MESRQDWIKAFCECQAKYRQLVRWSSDKKLSIPQACR
nr:MAG TPA: hypothetical protein [Caudoviricetes sp.]DAN28115.1 MAG TPA: hypothetical protein [Caudoviricetes sp.]